MAKSKKTTRPVKKKAVKREEVYSKVGVRICVGDKAITAVNAKKWLGWVAQDSKVEATLLRDETGKYVHCTANVTNRPLYSTVYATLKQEHLRGRWQFNGEPIIISKTGMILNGQHTLISLILAAQAWTENPEAYPDWKTEPTMEKLVVVGVSDDDHVVNTMDTCKPRSLADIIYRSAFFAGVTQSARTKLARMASFGISTLWERVGMDQDAFSPKRTHSEAIDFIEKHPKLLDCVRHIYEESDAGGFTELIPAGYAAGLMYLMAASASDGDDYREAGNESALDFSRWESATEFWTLLAGGDAMFKPLSTALANIIDEDGHAPRSVQFALIVKAWGCFIAKQRITEKRLELDFAKDEWDIRHLTEHPAMEGIDLGKVEKETVPKETIPEVPDPTEEEIEERKAEEREARKAKADADAAEKASKKKNADEQTKPKGKKSKSSSTKITGPLALVNKTMWVKAETPYQVRVGSIHGDRARVKIANGHAGAGNKRMVPLTDLTEKQPTTADAA